MVVRVWQESVNRVVDRVTLGVGDAVRPEDTVPEIYRRPGHHLFEQCEFTYAVCCVSFSAFWAQSLEKK